MSKVVAVDPGRSVQACWQGSGRVVPAPHAAYGHHPFDDDHVIAQRILRVTDRATPVLQKRRCQERLKLGQRFPEA